MRARTHFITESIALAYTVGTAPAQYNMHVVQCTERVTYRCVQLRNSVVQFQWPYFVIWRSCAILSSPVKTPLLSAVSGSPLQNFRPLQSAYSQNTALDLTTQISTEETKKNNKDSIVNQETIQDCFFNCFQIGHIQWLIYLGHKIRTPYTSHTPVQLAG